MNNEADIRSALPRHIGLIMDGNGRWAAAKGKARSYGHRAGVSALRSIISHCGDLGIEYVTVYAFSTENFKRSSDEVGTLMALLSDFLTNDLDFKIGKNVRLRAIGETERFSAMLAKQIRRAEERSKDCTKMTLNIALAYGSRAELVRAARILAQKAVSGEIKPEDITQEMLAEQLYTGGEPDPDLIIRTSGEMRLSNFMLYQAAYSELYFTPVLWPDFTPEELDKAIEDYRGRTRRFGGV